MGGISLVVCDVYGGIVVLILEEFQVVAKLNVQLPVIASIILPLVSLRSV